MLYLKKYQRFGKEIPPAWELAGGQNEDGYVYCSDGG